MPSKAELIFMKWKAELAEMDKSRDQIEGNFELLFDAMYRAKIKMNVALPFLEKAYEAHYPTEYVIKNTYRKMKKYPGTENYENFSKSWKKLISDTAKRVFFAFYEIEGIDGATNKKIGGQSKVERVKQRQYLDSIPTIDWEAIVREKEKAANKDIDETKTVVPDIDLDAIDVDIDLGEL